MTSRYIHMRHNDITDVSGSSDADLWKYFTDVNEEDYDSYERLLL